MFVDLKKVPNQVLENIKNEIECALIRAEVDEDIRKLKKFMNELEEVKEEMKERRLL